MPRIPVNTERILLFKPMNGYYAYIRKGLNYSTFKALATVTKDNKVKTIGAYPHTRYKFLKDFSNFEIKIFGRKRYTKGNPNDLYYIYYIMQPLPLDKPLPLTKPVRGMRYATDEETYSIKKEIIKALARLHNVSYEDVFWNWGEYSQLYSESIQLDFQDVLFDLEKSGELYDHWNNRPKKTNSHYRPVGVSGQTKLM